MSASIRKAPHQAHRRLQSQKSPFLPIRRQTNSRSKALRKHREVSYSFMIRREAFYCSSAFEVQKCKLMFRLGHQALILFSKVKMDTGKPLRSLKIKVHDAN